MTATILLPALLLAAGACVTIQVHFPAARIQNLSEQIEAEVERKARERGSLEVTPATSEPSTPPASGATPGGIASPPKAELHPLEILLGIRAVHAAEGDVPAPGVSSPAIRAIIDSRATRVAELNGYKSQGIVGENNQALVEARTLDQVSDLALRAAVQRIVEAENKDRRLLFDEIAAAEGVDRAQVPRIQTTYAETLRRHARPGDWIQQPGGSWEQAR